MQDLQALERAKSVYGATKKLQLADIPPLDITDRISLLTVAAGLRPVGVLEADGLAITQIRDVLISHGFSTSLANSVWSERRIDPTDPDAVLLSILYSNKKAPSSSKKVLWIYENTTTRTTYKNVALNMDDAGLLLSYPDCCVRNQLKSNQKLHLAFLAALVRKFGNDTQAIANAIKEDVGVDVPEMEENFSDVSRTSALFPFVIHIACEACLQSDSSPTAALNSTYSSLIFHIDPAMHRTVLEMSSLLNKMTGANTDRLVMEKANELYAKLFGR